MFKKGSNKLADSVYHKKLPSLLPQKSMGFHICGKAGRAWNLYHSNVHYWMLNVPLIAAALEALRLKAEPPSEAEFKETYSKCKFALNLIAKLGHHLSAPSASELQAGIFSTYIARFVSINKG